ncbi:hypothetical protein, partial [Empedobacter brevis]
MVGNVSEVLLHYNTLITNKIIHNNTKGKLTFAFCYFIRKMGYIFKKNYFLFLNLPTEVLWRNGDKISYTYDASGVKLAKVVTEGEGVRVTTTDYINGFQYKQVDSPTSKQVKRLEFFPTTEGYVSVTGGTTFNYVYNYTDH